MPPTTKPAPKHVLAVNNDEAVLALFRDLLEDEGYRVTTRRYADRDLAQIRAAAPDLVVLDYMWHDEDENWSLLQMLRMDPGTAAIPIVLCTGAVREAEALGPRLAAMGVRVLLKPFNIDDLYALIAEALAHPAPVGPGNNGTSGEGGRLTGAGANAR